MTNEGMILLLAAGRIDAVKDVINRIWQPEPFLMLSVIGLAILLKGYRFFTKPRVALAMLGLFIIVFAGSNSGPDCYGRVIDLNYTKTNGTVYRYQYGYDSMGNRLYARITQRSTNGTLHLNDRSHLYVYDDLQRLVAADTGKLNTGNTALQSGTLILGVDWTLDNLGNWSGDIAAPYESVTRTGNFDQDPDLETIAINHDVDAANRLESVTTDGTSVAVPTDRAGNVIHDGNYVQRYDAWNRLLEVYEPGTAVLNDYGVVTDGELGALIATYSYDGVGRLITIERTQSGEPVTIDLYYDGVRRIQERVTTDEPEGGQQMMAGGGGLSEPITQVMGLTPGPEDFGTPAAGGEVVLAEGTPLPPNPPGGDVDPEADDAAIRLDASSTAVSEPPSPEGGEFPLGGGMMGMSGQTIIAEREYIWGPDYVDECIVQLDENNTAYYVIQDANYNVVALLDATGLPVAQYTYEPYGALQLAESFAQHPVNRLGHQGLFFERFDAGPYDPALVPAARGLYYARNRLYEPVTARWTTKDPNETALPVITALARNGTSLDVLISNVDIKAQCNDGMNLYQYASSNPVVTLDPLGLDDFDLLVVRDWDEIWDSIVGQGNAYLGVQGAATWGSAYGGNVASLPQFAQGMMGVSDGVSQYADFYAEQVMYLPIDAAMKGFGAFNTYAKVTSSGSTKFSLFSAAAITARKAKSVNLPSWRRIAIDMVHILSGHTQGGSRVSSIKSLFPANMSALQIENTVRQAYRFSKRIGNLGGGVIKLRGQAGGQTIEMIVDVGREVIRSAWPI